GGGGVVGGWVKYRGPLGLELPVCLLSHAETVVSSDASLRGRLPLCAATGRVGPPSRQSIGQGPRLRSLGGSLALRPVGAGFGCACNGSNQIIDPIACSSSQEFFILMETHEQVIHWSSSLW